MQQDGYASINILFEMSKEEYNYQRERLGKLESRIALVIGIVSPVFAFEIANVHSVFGCASIDSMNEGINIIKNVLWNFPYCMSISILIITMVLLFYIGLNIKCKIIDIVKLYNNKIYSMEKEDVIPYLTALYVKCSYHNMKSMNRLFRLLNIVIGLVGVSFILFGVSYLY